MSKIKQNLKMLTAGAVLGGVLFSGVSYAASATNIDVYFQPLKYFFDGVEKKAPADQQGFIYQGTTYVPLRFVSEALGKQVGYEGKTSSIYVGQQPSGEKTFLDDLKPLSKEVGNYGWIYSVGDFKTNTGSSFTHATYGYGSTGDGTDVLTEEFLLNGNYNTFEAVLAPGEYWSSHKKDNIGSLKIYADDKLIYESGNIASNISNPVKVNANVKGALKIKIEFTTNYLGLLDAAIVS